MAVSYVNNDDIKQKYADLANSGESSEAGQAKADDIAAKLQNAQTNIDAYMADTYGLEEAQANAAAAKAAISGSMKANYIAAGGSFDGTSGSSSSSSLDSGRNSDSSAYWSSVGDTTGSWGGVDTSTPVKIEDTHELAVTPTTTAPDVTPTDPDSFTGKKEAAEDKAKKDAENLAEALDTTQEVKVGYNKTPDAWQSETKEAFTSDGRRWYNSYEDYLADTEHRIEEDVTWLNAQFVKFKDEDTGDDMIRVGTYADPEQRTAVFNELDHIVTDMDALLADPSFFVDDFNKQLLDYAAEQGWEDITAENLKEAIVDYDAHLDAYMAASIESLQAKRDYVAGERDKAAWYSQQVSSYDDIPISNLDENYKSALDNATTEVEQATAALEAAEQERQNAYNIANEAATNYGTLANPDDDPAVKAADEKIAEAQQALNDAKRKQETAQGDYDIAVSKLEQETESRRRLRKYIGNETAEDWSNSAKVIEDVLAGRGDPKAAERYGWTGDMTAVYGAQKAVEDLQAAYDAVGISLEYPTQDAVKAEQDKIQKSIDAATEALKKVEEATGLTGEDVKKAAEELTGDMDFCNQRSYMAEYANMDTAELNRLQMDYGMLLNGDQAVYGNGNIKRNDRLTDIGYDMPDGGTSAFDSMVYFDEETQKYMVIPLTIKQGENGWRRVDEDNPDAAIDYYKSSGEYFGVYDSLEDAEAAKKELDGGASEFLQYAYWRDRVEELGVLVNGVVVEDDIDAAARAQELAAYAAIHNGELPDGASLEELGYNQDQLIAEYNNAKEQLKVWEEKYKNSEKYEPTKEDQMRAAALAQVLDERKSVDFFNSVIKDQLLVDNTGHGLESIIANAKADLGKMTAEEYEEAFQAYYAELKNNGFSSDEAMARELYAQEHGSLYQEYYDALAAYKADARSRGEEYSDSELEKRFNHDHPEYKEAIRDKEAEIEQLKRYRGVKLAFPDANGISIMSDLERDKNYDQYVEAAIPFINAVKKPPEKMQEGFEIDPTWDEATAKYQQFMAGIKTYFPEMSEEDLTKIQDYIDKFGIDNAIPKDSWTLQEIQTYAYYLGSGDIETALEYAHDENRYYADLSKAQRAQRIIDFNAAMTEKATEGTVGERILGNAYLAAFPVVSGAWTAIGGALAESLSYYKTMIMTGEEPLTDTHTITEILNLAQSGIQQVLEQYNFGGAIHFGDFELNAGHIYSAYASTIQSFETQLVGSKVAGTVLSFAPEITQILGGAEKAQELLTSMYINIAFGGSALAQGAQEAFARTGDVKASLETGIANAIAEGLFETISLDILFNKLPDATSVVGLMLEGVGQGFVEGTEEVNTTVFNRFADWFINQDMSEWEARRDELVDKGYTEAQAEVLVKQEMQTGLIQDFTVGAMSGGFSAEFKQVQGYTRDVSYGKGVVTAGLVDAMIDLGESMKRDPVTLGYTPEDVEANDFHIPTQEEVDNQRAADAQAAVDKAVEDILLGTSESGAEVSNKNARDIADTPSLREAFERLTGRSLSGSYSNMKKIIREAAANYKAQQAEGRTGSTQVTGETSGLGRNGTPAAETTPSTPRPVIPAAEGRTGSTQVTGETSGLGRNGEPTAETASGTPRPVIPAAEGRTGSTEVTGDTSGISRNGTPTPETTSSTPRPVIPPANGRTGSTQVTGEASGLGRNGTPTTQTTTGSQWRLQEDAPAQSENQFRKGISELGEKAMQALDEIKKAWNERTKATAERAVKTQAEIEAIKARVKDGTATSGDVARLANLQDQQNKNTTDMSDLYAKIGQFMRAAQEANPDAFDSFVISHAQNFAKISPQAVTQAITNKQNILMADVNGMAYAYAKSANPGRVVLSNVGQALQSQYGVSAEVASKIQEPLAQAITGSSDISLGQIIKFANSKDIADAGVQKAILAYTENAVKDVAPRLYRAIQNNSVEDALTKTWAFFRSTARNVIQDAQRSAAFSAQNTRTSSSPFAIVQPSAVSESGGSINPKVLDAMFAERSKPFSERRMPIPPKANTSMPGTKTENRKPHTIPSASQAKAKAAAPAAPVTRTPVDVDAYRAALPQSVLDLMGEQIHLGRKTYNIFAYINKRMAESSYLTMDMIAEEFQLILDGASPQNAVKVVAQRHAEEIAERRETQAEQEGETVEAENTEKKSAPAKPAKKSTGMRMGGNARTQSTTETNTTEGNAPQTKTTEPRKANRTNYKEDAHDAFQTLTAEWVTRQDFVKRRMAKGMSQRRANIEFNRILNRLSNSPFGIGRVSYGRPEEASEEARAQQVTDPQIPQLMREIADLTEQRNAIYNDPQGKAESLKDIENKLAEAEKKLAALRAGQGGNNGSLSSGAPERGSSSDGRRGAGSVSQRQVGSDQSGDNKGKRGVRPSGYRAALRQGEKEVITYSDDGRVIFDSARKSPGTTKLTDDERTVLNAARRAGVGHVLFVQAEHMYDAEAGTPVHAFFGVVDGVPTIAYNVNFQSAYGLHETIHALLNNLSMDERFQFLDAAVGQIFDGKEELFTKLFTKYNDLYSTPYAATKARSQTEYDHLLMEEMLADISNGIDRFRFGKQVRDLQGIASEQIEDAKLWDYAQVRKQGSYTDFMAVQETVEDETEEEAEATEEVQAEETPAAEETPTETTTVAEEAPVEEKPKPKKKKSKAKAEGTKTQFDVAPDPNHQYTADEVESQISLEATGTVYDSENDRPMSIDRRSWSDTVQDDFDEPITRAEFVARLMNGISGTNPSRTLRGRRNAGAAMDLFDATLKNQGGDVENKRFSLVGTTDDGMEVYETSAETKKLSKRELQDAFTDMIKDEYKHLTARFEHDGVFDYARLVQPKKGKSKLVYGDKKSRGGAYKAKLRAGVDGDLFTLAEGMRYTGPGKEHKADQGGIHATGNAWTYYRKTVQIDGSVFDVMVDVKETPDGEFLYDMWLRPNGNKKAVQLYGTSNNGRTLHRVESAGNNIPQRANGVKRYSVEDGLDTDAIAEDYSRLRDQYGDDARQMLLDQIRSESLTNPPAGQKLTNYRRVDSKETSQGTRLSKKQGAYFKNSVLRDGMGRLYEFYRGTGNFDHTIFDFNKSRSGRAMFLTNNRDVAYSYAGSLSNRSYMDTDSITPASEVAPQLLTGIQDLIEESFGTRDIREALDQASTEQESDFLYAAEDIIHMSETGELESQIERGGQVLRNLSTMLDNAVADEDSVQSLIDLVGTATKSGAATMLVNMQNPFIMDGNGADWDNIPVNNDIADFLQAIGRDLNDGNRTRTNEIAMYAYALGYDGVVIQDLMDVGLAGSGIVNRDSSLDMSSDVLIVFDSNQAKDIKNLNPTDNADYRYSAEDDRLVTSMSHTYEDLIDLSEWRPSEHQGMHEDLQERMYNAVALWDRVVDYFDHVDENDPNWLSYDEITQAMQFNLYNGNYDGEDMPLANEIMISLSGIAQEQTGKEKERTYRLMDTLAGHLTVGEADKWTRPTNSRFAPTDAEFSDWYNEQHPNRGQGYTAKTEEDLEQEFDKAYDAYQFALRTQKRGLYDEDDVRPYKKAYDRASAILSMRVNGSRYSVEGEIGQYDLEDFQDAQTTDGRSLFSIEAIRHDEPEYRNMLLQWGGMSNEDIDDLFDTIDAAMDIIQDHLEELDYAWDADIDDRGFSPIKPNSDKLYKVSQDFSTLCRKRILQGVVQNQLQDALDRALTRDEGIAIRDALVALQEEGKQIEVACALCYVESVRMRSPAQIQRFLNNREKVIKDFYADKDRTNTKQKEAEAEAAKRQEIYEREGLIRSKSGIEYDVRDAKKATLKKLPGRIATKIREAKKAVKAQYQLTAEQQEMVNLAKQLKVTDFTTPEGLENLAKNHRDLFDAYTSFIRNATNSKGIENDTWWRAGDSQKISDLLIEQMNRENGLRTQSWSDFQVKHLMDYIAATIELATRGAKEHAYTKVIDYVDLMGNTGVMINMSLIPTREFSGQLEYDNVEGFVYDEAMRLRDKYHATAGTICIGVDNEQIRQLLASDEIDYVIPYHHSGMAAHTRKMMHIPNWDDYQDFQNEKQLTGNAAQQNAERFGATLLGEDDPNWHVAPKFSDWFDLQIAKLDAQRVGKTGAYGVMSGGYFAMQNAAERYKQICAERGLAPKFSYGRGDFADQENYWKLLIDRKMVDNITGDVIEQRAIKPVFDMDVIERILNDELDRYGTVKQDQDEAIRRVTEAFLSGNLHEGMTTDEIRQVMQNTVDNISVVNITGGDVEQAQNDLDSEENGIVSEERIEEEAEYETNSKRYSVWDGEEPRRVQYGFKLMSVDKNGLPHAMFIDAAVPYELGTWYKADSPKMESLWNLEPGYAYLVDQNDSVDMESRIPIERRPSGGFKGLPGKGKINEASLEGKRWMAVDRYADGSVNIQNVGINGSDTVSTFALRPGIHAVDIPSMTHIGAKSDGSSKIDTRRPNQRWFLIEYPVDVDYNQEAYSHKTKDIREHLPERGWYSFQTNSGAEAKQHWFITGGMRIVGGVREDDVRRYARDHGFAEDLPWKQGKAYSEDDSIDLYDYIRNTSTAPTPSKAEMKQKILAEREAQRAGRNFAMTEGRNGQLGIDFDSTQTPTRRYSVEIEEAYDPFGDEVEVSNTNPTGLTQSELSPNLYYSSDTAYYQLDTGETIVMENVGPDSPEARYINYLEAMNNANSTNSTATKPYTIPPANRNESNGHRVDQSNDGLRRGTEEVPAQDQEGTFRRAGSNGERNEARGPQSTEQESLTKRYSALFGDPFLNNSGDTTFNLYDEQGNVITSLDAFPMNSFEYNYILRAKNDTTFDLEDAMNDYVNTYGNIDGKSFDNLEEIIRMNDDLTEEKKQQLYEAIRKARRKYGAHKKGAGDKKPYIILPKYREDGKRVRKGMQTAASNVAPRHLTDRMMYEAMTNEILGYTPQSNAESIRRARNMLNNQFHGDLIKAMDFFTNMAQSGELPKAEHIALAELVITEFSADPNMYDYAVKLAADLSIVGTNLGQAVQAMRIIKNATPVGQLYYLNGVINHLNKVYAGRIEAKKMGRITLNQELAEKLLMATTREDINTAMEEIKEDLAAQIPASWLDKWNAWRYLAMLGNPRTHIRNMLGNAVFMPAVFAKDMILRRLEQIPGIIAPEYKMHVIGANKSGWLFGGGSAYMQFARNDYNTMQEVIAGKRTGNKFNDVSDILSRRQIFKNEALNFLEKKNSEWLENEDFWFQEKYYVRALAEALQAQGLTEDDMRQAMDAERNGEENAATFATTPAGREALNRARQYAMQQAQRNTYHELNTFATAMNKFKSTSGPVGNILMEGLAPFVSTPANILALGAVKYSPITLARSLVQLRKSLAEGDGNTMQILDDMAAGLTGTGVMILGALLTSFGLLRGGGSGDDDEDKFKKMQGHQNWSIEFPWFGNKKASYTIDWMAPMSMPLFVGSTIYQLLAGEADLSTPSNLWTALMGIADPMLAMSMLDGIENTLSSLSFSSDSNAISTLLASMATSYFAQGMPTLFGQIARTMDPNRRSTYVDKNSPVPGALQRFVQNSIQGKVPGWESKKMAYVDAWGRTDTTDSLVVRALENFLSPGYASVINETPVDEELERLYTATGDNRVLPGLLAKKFNVDGELKDLTADEYENLMKTAGAAAYNIAFGVISDERYAQADDLARREMILKAFEFAADYGRYDVTDHYALSANERTALAVGPEEYILTKNGLPTTYTNDELFSLLVTSPYLNTDQIAEMVAAEYSAPRQIGSTTDTGYYYDITDEDKAAMRDILVEELRVSIAELESNPDYINGSSDDRAFLLENAYNDARDNARDRYSVILDNSGREQVLGRATQAGSDMYLVAIQSEGTVHDQAAYLAKAYTGEKTIDNPDRKGYVITLDDVQRKNLKEAFAQEWDKVYVETLNSTQYKLAANDDERAAIVEARYKATKKAVQEDFARELSAKGEANEELGKVKAGYKWKEAYQIALDNFDNIEDMIDWMAGKMTGASSIDNPDQIGHKMVLDTAQRDLEAKYEQARFKDVARQMMVTPEFKALTFDEQAGALHDLDVAVAKLEENRYARFLIDNGIDYEDKRDISSSRNEVFFTMLFNDDLTKEEQMDMLEQRYTSKVGTTIKNNTLSYVEREHRVDAYLQYISDHFDQFTSSYLTSDEEAQLLRAAAAFEASMHGGAMKSSSSVVARDFGITRKVTDAQNRANREDPNYGFNRWMSQPLDFNRDVKGYVIPPNTHIDPNEEDGDQEDAYYYE